MPVKHIVSHLCYLFTICFRFGVVPCSFENGILVPLLKKPSLDASVATNYRHVILSTIFSKLIDLCILDKCSNFVYNECQFEFISGRGTDIFAHDVMEYCIYNGSVVFACSLDAEGAYDGIPHPILFMKIIDIVPDIFWRLLYNCIVD